MGSVSLGSVFSEKKSWVFRVVLHHLMSTTLQSSQLLWQQSQKMEVMKAINLVSLSFLQKTTMTQIKQLISYKKDEVYDQDASSHAPQSSLNLFVWAPLDSGLLHGSLFVMNIFKDFLPPSYGCLIPQKAGDTAQLAALITERRAVSHSSSGAMLLYFYFGWMMGSLND